jgi:hypothetical protein
MLVMMLAVTAGKRFCAAISCARGSRRLVGIDELPVLEAQHVLRVQEMQAAPDVAEQQCCRAQREKHSQ